MFTYTVLIIPAMQTLTIISNILGIFFCFVCTEQRYMADVFTTLKTMVYGWEAYRKPNEKIPQSAYFCFRGRSILQTVGSGRMITMKSVRTLMTAEVTSVLFSSRQVWLGMLGSQYARIGLADISRRKISKNGDTYWHSKMSSITNANRYMVIRAIVTQTAWRKVFFGSAAATRL
jgi:hypothetical protein